MDLHDIHLYKFEPLMHLTHIKKSKDMTPYLVDKDSARRCFVLREKLKINVAEI